MADGFVETLTTDVLPAVLQLREPTTTQKPMNSTHEDRAEAHSRRTPIVICCASPTFAPPSACRFFGSGSVTGRATFLHRHPLRFAEEPGD
jgi:hypothetical protein